MYKLYFYFYDLNFYKKNFSEKVLKKKFPPPPLLKLLKLSKN